MADMFENIAPSIDKFTSEIVLLPNHGVVDLHNEAETENAYREILRFLFKTIKQMENPKKTLEKSNELAKLRLKGLRELKELKPYISPYTMSRLNAEFRTWRDNPQILSEQRSDNMDKKIDKGFNDAIAEFMDLAGVYEDEAPCEDVDFDACFNIECEDEPEMSDEMGLELKDNDEDELDESIRDFLPKAGAFRNDDEKMIGGFVGNGPKDRIEKAKKIAKAKFYNGDRMGRVTDEEIDNFDKVYAELMRRAGREPELDETTQPKSYLNSINETTAGDGKFSDKELAQIGAITNKPTKKFKIYQSPMGEIVVTDHVLDRSWALMDEADTFDEIEDKILSDWEDANAVGYDKHLLNYPEVTSLPQFQDPMDDDNYFWDVSEYYKPLSEGVSEKIGIEDFSVEEPEENPVDVIRMDIPLFMRCLEFAREDAQDDADLHHLVEKATELSKDGKTLTMDNYDELAGGVSEGVVDEAKDPNVDAEWKTVRQNAKANPSLYGGRYADKDSKKARKEWETDRKENLKEGCSVKRKWKRIEKKSK